MGVQRWNEETFVVQLADDPALSDDVGEVYERLKEACCHVVMDLSDLGSLTSGGISKLLRLRKSLMAKGRRLILCAPSDHLWGVFLATGLDQVFEFAETVAEGLARAQAAEA
jgi:anti-anti-sigma factor